MITPGRDPVRPTAATYGFGSVKSATYKRASLSVLDEEWKKMTQEREECVRRERVARSERFVFVQIGNYFLSSNRNQVRQCVILRVRLIMYRAMDRTRTAVDTVGQAGWFASRVGGRSSSSMNLCSPACPYIELGLTQPAFPEPPLVLALLSISPIAHAVI